MGQAVCECWARAALLAMCSTRSAGLGSPVTYMLGQRLGRLLLMTLNK